jgi:hypothetical protein
MIKQTFDTHKDVESGKFISPRECRQTLWRVLEDLDQYLQPYHQREIKKKMEEIESRGSSESA